MSAPARPMAGFAWMLVATLCFVAVTGIVRHLGTALPAPQSVLMRFGFGILFLFPALVVLARTGVPRGLWPIVAGRGAVHAVGVLLWFYAMARIPVAEVTAIGYLSPILVTLGAALFLGERLALRRITAIGVALIGTLIILRPGLRELETGHMAQLAAAAFFAASYIFAKRLTDVLPPGAVVGLMSLSVTVIIAPLAIATWVPITPQQAGWLFLVAAFATSGHYCMTRAFALAPIAVTQPVTFLQLVWATALGALVFAEPVDPMVLLGGGLIILAISYITWREAMLRRSATPLAGAEKL